MVFPKLQQNLKSDDDDDDDAVHRLCSQRYKVPTVNLAPVVQVQILITCPICKISAVYNQWSGKALISDVKKAEI